MAKEWNVMNHPSCMNTSTSHHPCSSPILLLQCISTKSKRFIGIKRNLFCLTVDSYAQFSNVIQHKKKIQISMNIYLKQNIRKLFWDLFFPALLIFGKPKHCNIMLLNISVCAMKSTSSITEPSCYSVNIQL